MELLKPVLGNAQFVDKVKRLEAEIVNQNAETEKWHKEYQLYKDEYHRLVKEREKLIKHIDKLKQEFSAEQAKNSETEKYIAEFTDKSVAIAEMGERLMLFSGFCQKPSKRV